MTRIAIIGAGNVGGALHASARHSFADEDLVLCDTDEGRLARVGASRTTRDAAAAACGADLVVVAVKPQSFAALARQLAGGLDGKLVLSVMAGVGLEAIRDATGAEAVIRAMPNLGAQVRRCVTAWLAAPACSADQRQAARRLFQSMGAEIEVSGESLLDAFTALGGSGPAYFFYLAELLAERAVDMGFEPEHGRLIAREVLAASARLLESGEHTAEEWRRAVTTPGGTTAAALDAMVARGFPEAFRLGLEAARRRSRELNPPATLPA